MQTDDLPPELAVMAGIIGREKTLYIAGVYGDKSTMYVPLEPGPKHRLTQIIGLEDARKLAKEYAGIAMKIPKCAHIERRFRNESIVRLWMDGYSKPELAEMFNVCDRTIHNLVREHKRNERPILKQLTLFGGYRAITPEDEKKQGKKTRTTKPKVTTEQLSIFAA